MTSRQWKVVLAGECMSSRPFSRCEDPEFLAIIEKMRAADLTMAHLEMNFADPEEIKWASRNDWTGSFMIAEGHIADDFKWAGLPKATMAGRPGVNPLRVQLNHQVDAEAAKQLRRIAQKLHIQYNKSDKVEGGIQFVFPENQANRSVPLFTEGEDFRIFSKCHAHDLTGNLRSVDEAKQMSDLVIVSHHAAVAEGARGDNPTQYMVEFAHACIDAGADIYLAHGWHKTLGIEIYKGKPILYGLGNFFAHSEFNGRVPADSYESWGHDPDRMPIHNPAADPLHPGADIPTWWSSALWEVTMEDHRVTEIRLYPVNLGRDLAEPKKITRPVGSGGHPKTDGRPYLADPAAGAIILNRMRDISKPFGTTVAIENNVGIVRP